MTSTTTRQDIAEAGLPGLDARQPTVEAHTGHGDDGPRKIHGESDEDWWLTDITEHHTGQGKIYLRAIKDT